MDRLINKMSESTKGTIIMIIGLVLLLNTMGIKIINYAMFLASFILLIYGFVEAGFYKKIVTLIKGKHQ